MLFQMGLFQEDFKLQEQERVTWDQVSRGHCVTQHLLMLSDKKFSATKFAAFQVFKFSKMVTNTLHILNT
jgi:hypothetical protein